MTKVLIIEDEGIIAEGIKMNLVKLGYEVAGIAMNKAAFLDLVSSDVQFDVALVDIMLGKSPDGFEIAKYLKEQLKKPFIFATSYTDRETLTQAKYFNPSGYLVKPFQKRDLLACIEMISLDQETIEDDKLEFKTDHFFYKDQHLLKRVDLTKVTYVQSFKNYIEIIESNSQKHVIRCTLQDFLSKLPKNFLRVQKSYIVNIDFIEAVNSTYLLVNKKEIPLSKNYRDTLIKLLDIL
ncbi:MAG: response regulator transcription factor [Flavobacteriales bacterium]|nr:response regulator transcription factor [Flavobacteriales bacterium]